MCVYIVCAFNLAQVFVDAAWSVFGRVGHRHFIVYYGFVLILCVFLGPSCTTVVYFIA